MAFSPQEQQLIKLGIEKGKSRQEIEQALTNFRTGVVPKQAPITRPEEAEKPSLIRKAGESVFGEDGVLMRGAERVIGDVKTAASRKNPNLAVLELGVNIAGNVAGTAGELIAAPVMEAAKAVTPEETKEKITQILGELAGTDAFKKAQQLAKDNPEVARQLQNIFDIATLGIGGAAAKETGILAKEVAATGREALEASAKTVTREATDAVGSIKVPSIVADIIPGKSRLVNTELTRALDLTAGDVKNIAKSTGNEVGEWVASKNLIRGTKEETEQALKDFYQAAYKEVRDEIGKVDKVYASVDVPRYQEALKSIKKQISDVPGLQEANAEVDLLLKKADLNLNDVQRVKELLDEHFSLYKATGDVKEGIEKSGLANIRQDLRKFIEKEVQEATGADIRALNNDVSTSRSIADAVATRSTRGLTRANISTGDIVTFLTGSAVGSPLLGGVAVVAKKLLESPTLKLKFVKWLDDLSDAKKLKVLEDLEKGKLPPEIKLNQSSSAENSLSIASKKPATTKKTNAAKNDSARNISTDTTTPKPNMQRGAIKNPFAPKPSKIHSEDLATLSDFTDFKAGEYKPTAKDAIKLEEDVALIVEKEYQKRGLKIPKTVAGLKNAAVKLLEEQNFKR